MFAKSVKKKTVWSIIRQFASENGGQGSMAAAQQPFKNHADCHTKNNLTKYNSKLNRMFEFLNIKVPTYLQSI